MRYYEQRYPEVDELVMVQVRQIAEMGAYVKLVRLWRASPCICFKEVLNRITGIHLSLGYDYI